MRPSLLLKRPSTEARNVDFVLENHIEEAIVIQLSRRIQVETAMKSFSRWAIRARWPLLSAIARCAARLTFSTNGLVVDNDFDNWIPANDRVSDLFEAVDKWCSANALVFVVLGYREGGVFQPESLGACPALCHTREPCAQNFSR